MGVKLGQKWAVKDGNLLASNQVGSRFFNKEFDFSRASNGTYVDRDGLLKTAELYNLLSYSNDFSNAAWLQTDCIATSGQSGYDGSSDAWLISKSGSNGRVRQYMTSTGLRTASIYAKKGTTSWLRITYAGKTTFFDLGNGVLGSVNAIESTITSVGNGFYRCTLTANAASADYVNIYPAESDNVTSATSGSIYIQDAQLVEGTQPLAYQYTNGLQGLPRISFEDGVGHLLLEPQRSNLLLQSNSFDASWTRSNVSVTSGQSGVYGTNNAWLLEQISNGYLRQEVVFSGVSTFSIYAKSGTADGIYIEFAASTFPNLKVNLSTQSFISSANIIDYNIEDVGNGWSKISFTIDGSHIRVNIKVIDGSGAVTDGTLYIQHAQLESGSYPTSIIETTTTQITRLADVCNNSGSAQDFNSEEGVLYAEIASLRQTAPAAEALSISDGTSSNRVMIFYATTNLLVANVTSGGLTIVTYNLSLSDATEFAKVAIRYKDNDYSVFYNGTLVHTDLTGTAPTGLSSLQFDSGAGSSPFNGKVRNLQVFTEALSDAELQQLTT